MVYNPTSNAQDLHPLIRLLLNIPRTYDLDELGGEKISEMLSS